MKVTKIIEILSEISKNYGDVEVQYFDTWWDCEGWGEEAESAQFNSITSVTYDEEKSVITLV